MHGRIAIRLVLVILAAVSGVAAGADRTTLYAAGSLRNALTEVAAAYTNAYGVEVAPTFSPSGLLRKRIESGERPDVFASANMRHPRALADAGIGGPVVLFARNELCALAQLAVGVGTDTLLQVSRTRISGSVRPLPARTRPATTPGRCSTAPIRRVQAAGKR